ncbi:hypothetical protein P389DRAFT_85186 [Cystobasidium minutum MCA 4210]|uniref:uncharacterized protein n=1 Tax=Cystobasidium minutum MCA 4210 TaxID=1397322 RepID=UPI0034CDA495|eukprot:jgi/Rhomi1/85186/CE85185_247
MLHGESAKLEWTSSNRMAPESVPWRTSSENVLNGQDIADNTAEECSTSYALALYDPSTSTVSLIDAPLHILSHIPKRLKSLASMSSRDPNTSNMQARTDLGLTFGTKKAQKAIKAAERNKVDAGAQDLQVLQDVMQQGLAEGLETLPASSQNVGGPSKAGGEADTSSAVVSAAQSAGRPVPDLTAARPEDVYQIFGSIILTKEYDAITVVPLLKLSTEEKEKGCAMLPYKRSTWVNDRVKEVIANRSGKYKEKERVLKLKMLVWISALMALRSLKGGVDPANADALFRLFGKLVEFEAGQSLFERFTESVRATKNRQVTPGSEIRLLSHLFLVCLSYEGYVALDYQTLSNDMVYNNRKTIELLKMLGCRVVQPRGKDLERIYASWRTDGRTIPSLEGGKLKVASLIIPLEFPKEKSGKAKGRK